MLGGGGVCDACRRYAFFIEPSLRREVEEAAKRAQGDKTNMQQRNETKSLFYLHFTEFACGRGQMGRIREECWDMVRGRRFVNPQHLDPNRREEL